MRIARQQLGNRFSQDPHSMPVDDPHQLRLPKRRGIQKLVDTFAGFLGALANEIDLTNGGRELRTLVEGNRLTSRLRGNLWYYFFNVGGEDAHLQIPGLDFDLAAV